MDSAPVVIINEEPENITKNYELTYNDKIYTLTLTSNLKFTNSPITPEKVKVINFNLKEKNPNLYEDIIFYDTEKTTEDLAKIFLIDTNENSSIEKIIFEKIDNFHSNNNVSIIEDANNENIINLKYTQKIIDNHYYEIKIELNKNKTSSPNKNEILNINQSFNNLSKVLEELKDSFEKKLKEKEEENNYLKKLLKMNESKREIEPLLFKSDPSTLTQYKEIKEVVDGGRGMNDHFAVYNLVNDPKKTVYVAIKNKLENSQSSFINIIKIKSVDDYTIVQRLYGHNQRIVFVKYYLDPYTDNEYLLSADKEEVVIVWKILDKNNYKRFCYINTFYGQLLLKQSIYSCIIFFTEKKNYIYTTTVTKNYSRLYELEDGSFLRNVTITNNNYTLYLIKYKEYIIDICKDYIMIYNPFSEEIYDKIENERTKGENRSGCITYNKDNTDYLSVTNENGFIIIYDLIKKKIFKIFSSSGELYHIISWNLNYLIMAVHNYDSLWIISFDGKINKSALKSNAHLICVKKFILNGKEVMFCAGGQGFNSLYIYYQPK